MTKQKKAIRKLHAGHFAFMRALAQGLDERASWDRYLRLEGEHVDLRTVRRTIAWIRDEFAAAARREHKPGTARLILLDPDRLKSTPALPTLEDFARAEGLEDFSEAEQVEAYEAAYPATGRGSQGQGGTNTRRGRVIARQLDALHWLQNLVVQSPRASDSVEAWLHPALARRLLRAGVPTLHALVDRINGIGARWWALVPGIGERKAERILDWLRNSEEALGLRIGAHALVPRRSVPPASLGAVVSPAMALRPYEKFLPPPDLDGRAARLRDSGQSCTLAATCDHEAIGEWIASKASGQAGVLSPTQRAYRREAERLLLWSVLVRNVALSSLSVDDASAYAAFLTDVPAAWCGPRHHQRWSPMWRPLEGPLRPAAHRQALIILRSLFAYLVENSYVGGNPFATLALSGGAPGALGADRALSFAQWERIATVLQGCGETERKRRLRRGVRWLYATGLRLAEITAARCGDLAGIPETAADGTPVTTWRLAVTGKAGRRRQVAVSAELVEELAQELCRHGFEAQPDAPSNRGVPILARFDARARLPPPWSASGLYQAIKDLLAQVSRDLPDPEREQLRRASTHWLRHSYGMHSLEGQDARPSLSIAAVQNSLGHAHAATTALYLKAIKARAAPGTPATTA